MVCRTQAAAPERVRIVLQGVVQGVGFRPFVYRLASDLGLAGWTLNSSAGLLIEVQGDPAAIEQFLGRLETERPPNAVILMREIARLAPEDCHSFEIRDSEAGGSVDTGILPDLATCPECLRELFDPNDRRYRYPFLNCTHCGPRYSIVEAVPYDRPNTTMRGFDLCPDCRREYRNPADRRFHAQPVACPVCGPQLDHPSAIHLAAAALDRGEIVAWKGVGGFQLLVDAADPAAVARLRERKHRDAKPFALMMPDLSSVRRFCRVSVAEERALLSPAAPIVLLEPLAVDGLAPNVSDASPFLGVMLPYSPMHHLLMRVRPRPIVATSGNLSGDPILISNHDARTRLGAVADLIVAHNRPIARPCDDSVVRISSGREQVLRRARGFAPLPVRVSAPLRPVLAVGGHLKSSVAIARGQNVYLSQHLGDLDSLASLEAFEHAIEALCRLFRFEPELVACDLHPDYASTRWAQACGKPFITVQHHMAHAASCAAENGVRPPYLAVAWDGTGYGLDGVIWGGEFFLATGNQLDRVCHLRPFLLPGGDAAARQGWRAAAGIRFAMDLPPEPGHPQEVVRRMLESRLNCPLTTSAGRLFDAVASMAGIARESRFEGHAAMLLERAARASNETGAYECSLDREQVNWAPVIDAVERDVIRGVPAGDIARRFHAALARSIQAVARVHGARQVVLSGGVFQNALLTSMTRHNLERDGVAVFVHQRVPPNDGGLALGQAFLAGLSTR